MRWHDVYLHLAGAAWSNAGGIRRVIPLSDSLAKFLVRSRIRWEHEIASQPPLGKPGNEPGVSQVKHCKRRRLLWFRWGRPV